MARRKKRGRGRPKKTAAGAESSALAALAAEYKAFKQDNPARAARVPESVKLQAKQLYASGQTYSAIAAACDLSLGSVRAWIEPKDDETTVTGKPGRKPGRPLGRPIQGASAARDNWVTVKIRGNEVQVAETDFLKLLRGGLEAGR